jgi:4-amino-4-deoxy-L-arabinose transferase-like glycosyltransferase
MIEDRRTQRFVVAALCIMYVAARLWRVTDTCLWFDEIFSVHAAEHDWNSVLWFIARDLIHPPLFYIVLKIWIIIGGESLFWLRLLPVGFAAAAVFPFVLFCRELKLKFPAVAFALFLLALNGSFIRYAQSVRMYSMLTFLSLVSLWLFARYFNRGKNLAALTVVNVILVYTHYYGWMLVVAEISAILIFQRIKWRGMAAMFGTTFALFVPWLWFIWKASQSGSELSQNIKWITRPGFVELGTFAIDLIEPIYFQISSAEPASIYFISIPVLLIISACVAIYISRWKDLDVEEKRPVFFLLLFAFLPIAAVFAASWLMPYSIWGTRHLIIVVVPVTLLFSIAVTECRPASIRKAAIVLITLLSALALASESFRPKQVHFWCAWEGLALDIRSSIPQSETANIYTFENLAAYHIWFALRNTPNTRVSVIGGYEDSLTLEMYFLPRGFEDVRTIDLAELDDESFWMLFRTRTVDEQTPVIDALKSKGYIECRAVPIKFGPTNIFKFQMVKNQARCLK